MKPNCPVARKLLHNLFLSDPIVASAYYAYSCRLLSRIATVLGKAKDAEEYGALADKCRQAYIKEFIKDDGTTTVYAQKQAPYVRALAMGLYNQALHPKLVEKLIERVQQSNCHVGTGFLSTPFLCDVLSENGRSDLAYAILLQEDNPSWLYAINHGATTIWEDWNGIDEKGVPSASLNHYSKGAVVSWLYETMCGIQLDPEVPAYKHFYLKPQPGGGLSYARASYKSMYGEIRSGWEKTAAGMHYRFTVPANTRATVVLKNVKAFPQADEVENFKQLEHSAQFELPGGSYEFVFQE
jgi:alpha-L-rhamnosidase